MSTPTTNPNPQNAAACPSFTEEAPAAGRGVLTVLLQRNPLVALGAAILNPILEFFGRRRTTPTQIEKLRMETFRATPMACSPAGSLPEGSLNGVKGKSEPGVKDAYSSPEARLNGAYSRPEPRLNKARSRHGFSPLNRGLHASRRGMDAFGAKTSTGGAHHG